MFHWPGRDWNRSAKYSFGLYRRLGLAGGVNVDTADAHFPKLFFVAWNIFGYRLGIPI